MVNDQGSFEQAPHRQNVFDLQIFILHSESEGRTKLVTNID